MSSQKETEWKWLIARLRKKAARATLCADNLARVGNELGAVPFEKRAARYLMVAQKVSLHVAHRSVAQRHAQAA